MGGGTETQGTGANNAGAMGLYDQDFNYGGYDPAKGIATAFQRLGNSFQNQPTPDFMTAASTPTGSPYVASSDKGQTPGLIPTGKNDLIDVLRRLLSSGQGPTGIPMSLQ